MTEFCVLNHVSVHSFTPENLISISWVEVVKLTQQNSHWENLKGENYTLLNSPSPRYVVEWERKDNSLGKTIIITTDCGFDFMFPFRVQQRFPCGKYGNVTKKACQISKIWKQLTGVYIVKGRVETLHKPSDVSLIYEPLKFQVTLKACLRYHSNTPFGTCACTHELVTGQVWAQQRVSLPSYGRKWECPLAGQPGGTWGTWRRWSSSSPLSLPLRG